ncbi:MAG: CHAT domain-containing protein [Bacteroidales bacterium]|nr:CHAT domain-containing protein [Bacteroidales bacterium]
MRTISVYILLFSAFIFSFNPPIRAGNQVSPVTNDTVIINKLNSFKLAMQEGRPEAGDHYNWILDFLASNDTRDSMLISDCYYYAGTYKYLSDSYDESIELLHKSIGYRIAKDSIDDIYARARTNLALSYLYTGKTELARENLELALTTRENLFGHRSPLLLRTLINLSALYIDMNMYERALSVSLRGIQLAEEHPDIVDSERMGNLYYNTGVSYMNILDYNRAKRNFELAYSLNATTEGYSVEDALRSYISIAACNYELQNTGQSEYYFKKALDLTDSMHFTGRHLNSLYDNYSHFLAGIEEYDRAREYLLLSLEEAEKAYGTQSRDHILQLLNYAYFLLQYTDDYGIADRVLKQIIEYVNKNEHDRRVKGEACLYFSRLMYNTGRNKEALEYINKVIDDSLILSSRTRTASYLQKSKILKDMSGPAGDLNRLIEALVAAEKAIAFIEDARIRIKEYESSSRVSGRYFEAYDLSLSILYELYSLTGDIAYAERAFAISEKSRAAGLLLATRNNRTMNFQLPSDLAGLDRRLMSDLRDYNEVIYNESAEEQPDYDIINHYRLLSIKTGTRHDSLIKIFERDYPRYYNLKHNTGVSSLEEIRDRIGKKGNFIEYYLSDSLLFIFLVNDRVFEIKAMSNGDELRAMVMDFRKLLTNPSIVSGSVSQYRQYLRLASELYGRLVLPVKDLLTSDRLIISTDDILSYIPFETLIYELPDYDGVNYRELPYLLKEYSIVYEYSATLLSEKLSHGRSIQNRTLVFAPEYTGKLDVNDLMMSRQSFRDSLRDIPGAREEAIYINKLLGGSLYIDERATESAFKADVLQGDIIHLAMHTLLNDYEPMYSKMIFNIRADTLEDGMLNTYEVYNIPLKSKMVFLSSCNTGSGFLQSGEGVMSLARGFFYSGSPSVVMSLWEVDDLSASNIVKDFYSNLKKGLPKSKSLRKARMDYLSNADQMRSHPYFWSTLVVMGNDDAVYFPVKIYLILIIIIVAAYLAVRYYYRSVKE